jgi:hypothetical protein
VSSLYLEELTTAVEPSAARADGWPKVSQQSILHEDPELRDGFLESLPWVERRDGSDVKGSGDETWR